MDGLMQATADGEPLLDRGKLDDLTRAVGAETLSTMLGMVPETIVLELSRIDRALADGDLEAARRAAHGLKGTALNLGLVRLSRAAGALHVQLRHCAPADVSGIDAAGPAGLLRARLEAVARETLDAVSRA